MINNTEFNSNEILENYETSYKATFDKYTEMLNLYQTETASDRYFGCISDPYTFLDALQMYDKLKLFTEFDNPKMRFRTAEEAELFYSDMINTKRNIPELLNKATYIASVNEIAKNINELVENSYFLPDTFCVPTDDKASDMAIKCLEVLPKYNLTKLFRWNYIESVILSLDTNALYKLCTDGIIKADDIDHITLTHTDNNYREKIIDLCHYLNRGEPLVENYNLKLKGVTFPNDDGTSRQANLKELKDYVLSHKDETIYLTAENYQYIPEIGNPEPAIKVSWNGKCIGNIAQDAVANIVDRYQNPQFVATLTEVTGGERNMSMGCSINLGIIAPDFVRVQTENINEQEAVH